MDGSEKDHDNTGAANEKKIEKGKSKYLRGRKLRKGQNGVDAADRCVDVQTDRRIDFMGLDRDGKAGRDTPADVVRGLPPVTGAS